MKQLEGQAHCGRCKTFRALEDFPPSQRHNGGWCRSCRKAHYRATRPALPPTPCETCRRIIEEPKPAQRFCSPACKMKTRYWRLNPRQSRTCRACGTDITGKRADASYCSGRCMERARRSDGRVTSADRRRTRLLSEYGISEADYSRMLADQGGGCAICGDNGSGSRGGVLHVDHCHKTKRIRGLLCERCNMGLGQLGDDPARLRRAADYLDGGLPSGATS